MMGWRAFRTASVLAIFATFSVIGLAQDTHSQRAALEKDIAALNQQITAKQQQITALRNKPSPEQADVTVAKKALDAARADLKTSPGPDSEGKVRNAEFKLKLAQMRFDKANDGIEALDDDIDKLKQQISVKQQQIKDLNNQATAQVQAQQQELARTKQEAEAAQKEIERLKAALAAQEAAAAKATAAKAAAVPAPKAMESTPAVPKSAAKPAAAQSEATKATAAAPATSAATTAATVSAVANGLVLLSSQSEVLHQLQATTQLVAQAGRNEDEASLVLYLKHPDAKATNKNKITLRALGNGQYRGSANVDAGQYEAVVGFNRWPVQFADKASGEMTFICDYRNKNAAHLVIYRSALEGVSE